MERYGWSRQGEAGFRTRSSIGKVRIGMLRCGEARQGKGNEMGDSIGKVGLGPVSRGLARQSAVGQGEAKVS